MNNIWIKSAFASIAIGILTSNGFADFSVIPEETFEYTARAQTSGDGKVDIAITIKNTDNSVAAIQEIIWPTVTNTMITPSNKWIMANQMAEIDSTITTLSGGVQLITDNMGAGADPLFVDPTKPENASPPDPYLNNNADSNPAGLVLDYNGNHSYTLPVAWTIKDSVKDVTGPSAEGPNGLKPSDPNNGPISGSGYRYQWLYLVDKQTPEIDWNGNRIIGDTVNGIKDGAAYSPGADYQRILDYRGRHVGQDQFEFIGGPGKKLSYVYFQANFETALFGNAANPVKYRTNKLTFEAFTE